MKRVYILGFLLGWSLTAHAGATIVGVGTNAAGGHNAIMKDPSNCSSGFGFLADIPFKGAVRGCITSFTADGKNFHVYFENDLEADYAISGFADVPAASKTSSKGDL